MESWAQPFPRTRMLRPSEDILRGPRGFRQPLTIRRQFTNPTNYRLARWACLFQREVHIREQLVLRRIALQIQIVEIDWEVTQLLSAMR